MATAVLLAISLVIVWSVRVVHAVSGAGASYARGLIAFDAGSWDDAYNSFDRAVEADPEFAMARYYRGLTQARRGELEAAIEDLGAAIEIDPGLRPAVLDLGIAHFDDGNYEEAVTWLEGAYGDEMERRTAALFLGLTKYRLGEYAEAVRYLEEAKADPKMRPVAHYYSALALADLGRVEQSRLELASAASAAPSSQVGAIASRYATGSETSIAGASPWSVFADTQLGYDSNVVIGPSDGTGDTSEDGDGAWVIAVGGQYHFIQSDSGVLTGSIDLSQSVHFDRTDFDLTGTRMRLDWQAAIDWFEYGLNAGYDFYGLNYQTFYQDALMTPWVAAREGDVAATQLFYGFRYRDFFRAPFSPYRDGFNNSVGARQYFLLPDGVSVVHGGYRFEVEDPEHADDDDFYVGRGARDFEYDGNQFDVGVSTAADLAGLGPLSAEAGYSFRYDDYAHRNSRTRSVQQNGTVTNGLHRHDAEHEVALSVGRDLAPDVAVLRAWTDGSMVTVTFIAVVNDSNIDEFQYDRFLTMVGFQARF